MKPYYLYWNWWNLTLDPFLDRNLLSPINELNKWKDGRFIMDGCCGAMHSETFLFLYEYRTRYSSCVDWYVAGFFCVKIQLQKKGK